MNRQDKVAQSCSCAASEPELPCLVEVQAADVHVWLHLNKYPSFTERKAIRVKNINPEGGFDS